MLFESPKIKIDTFEMGMSGLWPMCMGFDDGNQNILNWIVRIRAMNRFSSAITSGIECWLRRLSLTD